MVGSRTLLARLTRFGAVGLLSNVSLYALYLVAIWIGLRPTLTSSFCYMLGVAASYILNRRFTFRSGTHHVRDLPRFLLAYAIGLAVTVAAMHFMVKPLGPALAQLLTIVLAAVAIFVSLLALRFGQPQKVLADVEARHDCHQ